MAIARELLERRRTVDGEELGAEVVARLLVGRSLSGLPIEFVGGRLDLRGLPMVPGQARRSDTESYLWS